MKVQKYYEFLFEGNTPDDFMKDCLEQIKNRLTPLFNGHEETESVKKMKDFEKFNLELEGEPAYSLNNPEEKSIKFKFTDQETLYILNICIKLQDAMPVKDQDFLTTDIKKAHVTFDRYKDIDGKFTKLPGGVMSKTFDPSTIDGDFLIKLKIELDSGKPAEGEEEFKIETGEKEMPEEESKIAEREKIPENKPIEEAPAAQSQTPQ